MLAKRGLIVSPFDKSLEYGVGGIGPPQSGLSSMLMARLLTGKELVVELFEITKVNS